jgi:hypothetical protein
MKSEIALSLQWLNDERKKAKRTFEARLRLNSTPEALVPGARNPICRLGTFGTAR